MLHGGTSDESEAGVFCDADVDEDDVVKSTARGKKDWKPLVIS
jgi:uncharacterized protein YegL